MYATCNNNHSFVLKKPQNVPLTRPLIYLINKVAIAPPTLLIVSTHVLTFDCFPEAFTQLRLLSHWTSLSGENESSQLTLGIITLIYTPLFNASCIRGADRGTDVRFGQIWCLVGISNEDQFFFFVDLAVAFTEKFGPVLVVALAERSFP